MLLEVTPAALQAANPMVRPGCIQSKKTVKSGVKAEAKRRQTIFFIHKIRL